MKLIVFFSVVALAFAAPSQDRIIGGENADIKTYPWQVSLRRSTGPHYCGGSLVDSKHIVTAAHCKLSVLGSVIMGTSTPDKGSGDNGKQIKMESFIQYPNYTSDSFDYDYAVITLESAVEPTDYIKSISLPSSSLTVADFENTIAVTTGWGYYKTSGFLNQPVQETAPILQMANMPILNQSDCQDQFSGVEITPNMICAGAAGATSCSGDSGGPLAENIDGVATLIGAVSFGYSSCSTSRPGVYAFIPSQVGWIEKTIADNP